MFTIILNAVKENKLFSNVKKSEISFKVTPDKLINRKKEEPVYCEGDAGDFIFLIISGEVVIIKKSFLGKETRELRQTNDFFGEEDFLEEMPRMSMAVATEDTRLLVLNKQEINYYIYLFEPVLSNLKRIPLSENFNKETDNAASFSGESVKKETGENERNSEFQDTPVPEMPEEQGLQEADDLFLSRTNIPDPFAAFIKSEAVKSESFRLSDEIELSEHQDGRDESFSETKAYPADESMLKTEDPAFEDIYASDILEENITPFETGSAPPEEEQILFDAAGKNPCLTSDAAEEETSINETSENILSEESNHMDDDTEKELTGEQLRHIIQAAHIVNSNIKLDDVLNSIVEAARNLTEAERGTLYIVDRDRGELWSKIIDGKGITEIRLKIGEGIAGWVAENKQTVNIKDAKSDPRFASRIDHMSGYETRNMLCFPIVNKSDEVIGVLQLLNGRPGKFTKLDEQFLSALSIHAALALENAELVEKLLQTERITSLGKMANFLIQDIKKPVLVSKRYAEHLKTKQLTPDVAQVVDMLLEQLNHVTDLVQTTSSYSEGKTVLQSVICKINETLDEVLTKLQSNVILRKCEIVRQYDKDTLVKLDRKEFYQCCFHIIRNACDAMPDGGKIFITTKLERNSVEISFRDTGLGIPDSIKDKIFEPFMSHGKKEGTGLGLSITKKIVEDHGGTINVESDLGEGATFTITLPSSAK